MKKTVLKNEADILLIRKYLNGELDARAMHQLERRALDDPFLMDAMEGYENTENDQQASLNDITNRLQRRVSHKQVRVISWRLMAIAASVLVVFTIGGLWLFNRQPEKLKMVQLVLPKAEPKADVPLAVPSSPAPIKPNEIAATKQKSPPKISQGQIVADNIAHRPLANDQLADAKAEKSEISKDTTPLNEMIVMESQKKKPVLKEVTISSPNADKKATFKSSDQLLQARVPGVSVTAPPTQDYRYLRKEVLRGQVVGKKDGLPIPGATVKVAGTNIGTQTDANGRFNLPVDSSRKKSNLVVGYIGYQTLQVSANSADSVKTIAMVPNHSALSEVVVTEYNPSQKHADDAIIDAHPREGWSSFNKYLKENAISPDGKTGIVKLLFTVNPNGSITDIKVTKSLSTATDKKAIDLINNWPGWTSSTSGKPDKVRVRVKFAK